jgi:hypothetical protein
MSLLKKKKATESEDLGAIEQRNKENAEAQGVAIDGGGIDQPHRKKNETQAEYNERVPVALQPVQPGPTHSYLGDKL